MFNLKASVHLEEEELAVLEQEFDSAGVDVTAGLGDRYRGIAHCLTNFWGEVRCRALFNEFLMTTLGRTIALGDPDAVAMGVGDDLHFDVARPCEIALDVALVATKAFECFALGGVECLGRFVFAANNAHAATAAAVGRFNRNWPTMSFTERNYFRRIFEKFSGSRNALHSGSLCGDTT
ncbi:unannotated protein [freshwater metagenome]|uniref:Unannotated protein n=1 Tax=freshwater metagenome TaxID=449393 RepID=A0A6J5YXJ9_9ZZZZ